MACRHGKAIDERCLACAADSEERLSTPPDTIYGWSWSYVMSLLDAGCVCRVHGGMRCPVHTKFAPPDVSLRRALCLVRRMTKAA